MGKKSCGSSSTISGSAENTFNLGPLSYNSAFQIWRLKCSKMVQLETHPPFSCLNFFLAALGMWVSKDMGTGHLHRSNQGCTHMFINWFQPFLGFEAQMKNMLIEVAQPAVHTHTHYIYIYRNTYVYTHKEIYIYIYICIIIYIYIWFHHMISSWISKQKRDQTWQNVTQHKSDSTQLVFFKFPTKKSKRDQTWPDVTLLA